MKTKLMIAAAFAGAVLSGSGLADADPADEPQPDPNGPKCWVMGGDIPHYQLAPCGWTYSESGGWQQVPPDNPTLGQ